MAPPPKKPKAESVSRPGPRIRELREARGLTQEDLAAKAKVDRAELSRLETGKCANPGTKRLAKIANALGVELAEFFIRRRIAGENP